jgi:FixJ family two-component response regulator
MSLESVNLFVVDPDSASRQATIQTLEPLACQVYACASAGELLEQLDASAAACVVSRLILPDTDGLELLHRLSGRDVRCVFTADQPDPGLVSHVMRHGAVDCLIEPVLRHVLLRRVREAIALAEHVRARRSARDAARERLNALTDAERQVFDRLLEGEGNKQVARYLRVSTKTVESRRARVREKLGVDSLAAMMRVQLTASMCLHGEDTCPINCSHEQGSGEDCCGFSLDLPGRSRESAA